MTATATSRQPYARTRLAVVGFAALLPFLGQTHGVASRELRHAEIAREMARSGDLAVPTLLGETYAYKPPVLHALIAALYRLAGEPTLALARLPSVAAAVGGVILLYDLGLLLAGPAVASFAAWGLLGTLGWQHMARVARPDMLFVAAILASCLLGAHGLRARGAARGLLLGLAGMCAGLALVTKGPFGIGIPGLFVLTDAGLGRGTRRPTAADVGAALLGLCVAVAVWAVPAWLHDHGAYLARVIGQRDLRWQGDAGRRSLGMYVSTLVVAGLPLTLLVPAVVADVRRRGLTLAVLVVAVTFAVLAAAPKKRPHYLLPLYPFLALAVAEAVTGATDRPRLRRLAAASFAIAIVAGPVRLAVAPRAERGNVAAARAVLGVVGPAQPIVCLHDLGEEIAFLGRREGVTEVRDARALAARARSNGAGSWVVVPSWAGPAPLRRLRKTVDVEEVRRMPRRPGAADGWTLYRVRSPSPLPSLTDSPG